MSSIFCIYNSGKFSAELVSCIQWIGSENDLNRESVVSPSRPIKFCLAVLSFPTIPAFFVTILSTAPVTISSTASVTILSTASWMGSCSSELKHTESPSSTKHVRELEKERDLEKERELEKKGLEKECGLEKGKLEKGNLEKEGGLESHAACDQKNPSSSRERLASEQSIDFI